MASASREQVSALSHDHGVLPLPCQLFIMSLYLQIAYNIDIVKSNVPEALEILADAVLNPRFTTWEVAEQIVKMEHDIKGLKENPQTVLLEVTYQIPTCCDIWQPCSTCECAAGKCMSQQAAHSSAQHASKFGKQGNSCCYQNTNHNCLPRFSICKDVQLCGNWHPAVIKSQDAVFVSHHSNQLVEAESVS